MSRAAEDRATVIVLLAAYNGRAFLEDQLSSILGQTGVDVEVRISVDQSTDGTEEWVRERCSSDHRLELLPTAGRLGSAAANFYRLISDTPPVESEFVAFADQDDIWMPGKLAHAVQLLREQRAQGYSSSVYAWSEDRLPRLLDKSGLQKRWDHLFSSPGPGCTHVLSPKLFNLLRKLVTERRALVDQIEYHDWIDYALARSNDMTWVIDPVPRMLYRQHQQNQMGANVGAQAAGKRLEMLRADWLWDQASLVAEACGAQDELPMKLLRSHSLAARGRFMILAPKLRRKLRDGVITGAVGATRRTRPRQPVAALAGSPSDRRLNSVRRDGRS